MCEREEAATPLALSAWKAVITPWWSPAGTPRSSSAATVVVFFQSHTAAENSWLFLFLSSYLTLEMKIVSHLAPQMGSTRTAWRCREPWSAAAWPTNTTLLGCHWQLGCSSPSLLPWFPLTHTFLLIHTELPVENFYLTGAGWKCFMQMFYGKCTLHNINVYHGKIFILPKVKQNGRAFLQGSCDSHLIHLSPQGRFCPLRVIAVFPQVWLTVLLLKVQPSSWSHRGEDCA